MSGVGPFMKVTVIQVLQLYTILLQLWMELVTVVSHRQALHASVAYESQRLSLNTSSSTALIVPRLDDDEGREDNELEKHVLGF
jgi:hypothetical protein